MKWTWKLLLSMTILLLPYKAMKTWSMKMVNLSWFKIKIPCVKELKTDTCQLSVQSTKELFFLFLPDVTWFFICQENPRWSGISPFPTCLRVFRLRKFWNGRHPWLSEMVENQRHLYVFITYYIIAVMNHTMLLKFICFIIFNENSTCFGWSIIHCQFFNEKQNEIMQ